jgi:uncharacterized protein
MRGSLAGLALLAFSVAPCAAMAASFDCAQARTAIEKTICADPALSAADEELGRRFKAALRASLDPAGLRAAQAEWLHSRDQVASIELADAYANRRRELDAETARLLAGQGGRILDEAEAKTVCAPALVDASARETCKVADFVDLGALDGHSFAYADYEYAPGSAGGVPYSRMVVFEHLPAGMARVAISPDGDGAIAYQKPRLLHLGARALLHLPAYESGTGNFNRERLFVWRGDHWQDVDVTTWLNEMAHRLPVGLAVWKGVFPDYSAMKACTPVWRTTDGNCCPSGGGADLTLEWKDDRIALAGVRLKRSGECGAP